MASGRIGRWLLQLDVKLMKERAVGPLAAAGVFPAGDDIVWAYSEIGVSAGLFIVRFMSSVLVVRA